MTSRHLGEGRNKIWGFVQRLPSPFQATLSIESRVYYLGNTADRQTQQPLKYYHLSQSTANQNGESIHCHHWDSNL
jgi:hypothetical protein